MVGKVKTFNPSTLREPASTYTHVAAVEAPVKFVFTAGQVGADLNGSTPASYEAQIHQAFKNLVLSLDAAGAKPEDIAHLKLFIVNYDPNNRPHSKISQKYLKGHRPPTTLVPVPCLAKPEWLFEVEAIAAVATNTGNQNRSESAYDVVIVGAGLSGLQAAREVHKAGLSYVVLEARDRVGGKVWSVPAGGGFVDLGAAWTNDHNQPRVTRLSQELGLEFVEQNINGDGLLQSVNGRVSRFQYGHTPLFTLTEQKRVEAMRDLVEKLSHEIDTSQPGAYDKFTLEEFVRMLQSDEVVLSTVTVWTRAMLGVEPSELSAQYFLDYCQRGGGLLQMRSDGPGGGQHLRCKTGMWSLARGLLSFLKSGSVKLNSIVTAIDQYPMADTVVRLKNGQEYRGRKVIISLPTPLLQDVSFSPSLPFSKSDYSRSAKLGYYSKMIVVYKEPWWTKSGLCGLSQSFEGPISITRDTSNATAGHYSLTCFIVGEPGRQWSLLSKDLRQKAVMDQLATIFGHKHAADVQSPIEIFEQEWSKEEFSGGCPCPVTMPDALSRLGAVQIVPFHSVHFVGTETGATWRGYMEGALESGERGATEVVQALVVQQSPRRARL